MGLIDEGNLASLRRSLAGDATFDCSCLISHGPLDFQLRASSIQMLRPCNPTMQRDLFNSESRLIGIALALGAERVVGWSEAESRIASHADASSPAAIADVKAAIRAGLDPLGDAFCALRPPSARRESGATFTPAAIISSMINWAEDSGSAPERIVDPGAGSGRFMVAAGRQFSAARLVGVELDPVAAVLARGHLAAAGLDKRATIVFGDYREAQLPSCGGAGNTLFIGNPPYVRHHNIEKRWKEWLSVEANRLGVRASCLAGLHVHFILQTARIAAPGDRGCLITAAEWLDVNYGRLVRELFVGRLGGTRLVVIEPTAQPFPDAATTAVILGFEVGGSQRSVRVQRVGTTAQLGRLDRGKAIGVERLRNEVRWSHFTRNVRELPSDFVELGELCRVHRGQVTGANHVWIAGEHSSMLPASLLCRTVTKARELIRAGRELSDREHLKRVINLPVDLDQLRKADREAVERFLHWAKERGANTGYIAQHRRAWWAVQLRQPAPVLATYMARRPPAFVVNSSNARHLNIAHGLYPRGPMTEQQLRALVDFLCENVSTARGRTYAGGLTKFEPREMERLPVPTIDLLMERVTDDR